MDVFSKFLHLVPVKTNSVPFVILAFRSIFPDDESRRRTIWVRTDKSKEFLNQEFQDMLRDKGIQFLVCKYPDVKCAVVERAH